MHTLRLLAAALVPVVTIPFACSATHEDPEETAGGAGPSGASGQQGAGGGAGCDTCLGQVYTPCNPDGTPGMAVTCPTACSPGMGCVECVPDTLLCVGNEVHKCSSDGKNTDELVM